MSEIIGMHLTAKNWYNTKGVQLTFPVVTRECRGFGLSFVNDWLPTFSCASLANAALCAAGFVGLSSSSRLVASYAQSHPYTPDTPAYLHSMHNHTCAHLYTCILHTVTPEHTWHSCIPASYAQSQPCTPDTPAYLHPTHNHTHAHLTLLYTCILCTITPGHTWHSCIPASYAQSHPCTPVYLHPMDSHITRYVTNYTAVQNSYQETETPSAGTNLSAVSQHNPLPYQYMSKAIPDIQNHWSSMPKDDWLTRYDFPLVFYSNHRSRLNHCQIRSYCNSHERYVKQQATMYPMKPFTLFFFSA